MANKDTALAKPLESSELIAKIALTGNLAPLTDEQRWDYYQAYCRHLGLDPITRPFDILTRTEKDGSKIVTLYANASCSSQIADGRGVTYGKPEIEYSEFVGTLTVWVRASLPNGREQWNSGVVHIQTLSGKYLENAIKKAVTQAHRRATLALCGISMPDESELEDIAGAQTARISGPVGFNATATHPAQSLEDRVDELLRNAGSAVNETTRNFVIAWLKQGAFQALAEKLKCNADDLAREFGHLRQESQSIAPQTKNEQLKQEIRDELKPAREKLAEAKERNKSVPPPSVPRVYTAENRAHSEGVGKRLDRAARKLVSLGGTADDLRDTINNTIKREEDTIIESRFELTDEEANQVIAIFEQEAAKLEAKAAKKTGL